MSALHTGTLEFVLSEGAPPAQTLHTTSPVGSANKLGQESANEQQHGVTSGVAGDKCCRCMLPAVKLHRQLDTSTDSMTPSLM